VLHPVSSAPKYGQSSAGYVTRNRKWLVYILFVFQRVINDLIGFKAGFVGRNEITMVLLIQRTCM
jgi:hypothetical protein